jgi:hypothetical protein
VIDTIVEYPEVHAKVVSRVRVYLDAPNTTSVEMIFTDQSRLLLDAINSATQCNGMLPPSATECCHRCSEILPPGVNSIIHAGGVHGELQMAAVLG